MTHTAIAALPWWQRGVIYQIWVRSFRDANGDGSGDLGGLIEKLDYLTWLGVDVLWISPIYPSPMIESGYDVSDYTDVNALFGDLATFDRLLEAAHARGLKILLDFVPNHTSDAHPWFQESRSSRDNPKRGYYLWHDPGELGGAPNNWVGCFGGSAWTYDKQTEQLYYHAFLPQQPDLNLRNPEVLGALADAMRFWLDRGVDGFRMDAVWHLIKDDQYRDNPVNENYTPDMPPDNVVHSKYTRDQPETHDVIAMMRGIVDERPDRLLAGEIYTDAKTMMSYYGQKDRPELHIPFNLQLSIIPWQARGVIDWIEEYYGALPEGAWPSWAVGTHDAHRIVSRAGEGQARVAAMLILTLRGTPTIYYGEEIGMSDADIPRAEVEDMREIMTPYLGLGRDPARTPMQWSREPNAGFTTGDPWLPIAGNADEVNVNAESGDPRSMLSLYRRLIGLRRETPALIAGGYETVRRDDGILIYKREMEGDRVMVALNFTPEPRSIEVEGAILLSTYLDRDGQKVSGKLDLRPDEGVILR